MTKDPAKLQSLIEVERSSADNLIGVVFCKSRSSKYAMALKLAKGAKLYTEMDVEGVLFHVAVFGLNKSEASRAVAVVAAVKDWRHTKIFARGRLLERHYNVDQTLRCYLNSLEAEEKDAHCNFIYRDLALYHFGKEADSYLVPCRMLQGFVQDVIRDPVASGQHMIKAAAVRRGCFWCPNFDKTKFKKLKPENRRLVQNF